MVDSPHLVEPGKKFKLKDFNTNDKGDFESEEEAVPATEKYHKQIAKLQEQLYAESKQALLVIFQAMDAGGKDGAIEKVFASVNPQGCNVHSFKVPSSLERSHDFLWRHHVAMPSKGMIGIHNRSHYESVLVERVHAIVPEKIWRKRYDQINEFENTLVAEGTTILKFFLHISKEEQKERLQARLADPSKHWKFSVGDLAERKLWDQYQAAFQDAIDECSTDQAPWYVIPADHKWYRNYAVCKILAHTLKEMDPKFPENPDDLSKVKVV
jgi:PPK2 family polyphosphate:nucleotide phosphotransferase